MNLTLLHTAKAHCATFDALRDRIAPGSMLDHIIRPDWLARAQNGIDDALAAEITQAVADAPGAVLCTCTTLGATATQAGAIRIDQPMMQTAAATGGSIVMAYCLDSTLGPSLDLLDAELAAVGTPAQVYPLPLRALWPLFEAGETRAFAIGIAGEIRQAIPQLDKVGCVVLAQASMAPAADLLSEIDIPVLTSPELALRAALAQ